MFKLAKRIVARFKKKEEAAVLVEYGLLVCLIGLACIGGLTTLGKNLGNMFNGVANTVRNVPTNAR
jgi:Flp pilus assembly pilin Flp